MAATDVPAEQAIFLEPPDDRMTCFMPILALLIPASTIQPGTKKPPGFTRRFFKIGVGSKN